jgi:hypothetical protein
VAPHIKIEDVGDGGCSSKTPSHSQSGDEPPMNPNRNLRTERVSGVSSKRHRLDLVEPANDLFAVMLFVPSHLDQ